MNVTSWCEKIVIPTYGIGEPEKNPMFFENRVYQGSSGEVYPYPIIEKIMDEKSARVWNAVFLENKYVKIMILPELGGRVQMAYDKTRQRHFVYYNQVIKPALVGLLGPWVSGGIEFNWPQHHRPTTYTPVDYSIEHNNDGSVTVWCSEVERMYRTRGMAGLTLYPDKLYLEINVKLYNRTNFPQTFLWWANPAVKVNDEYQSVFPPDVNAVFDHGKRDVSEFPIAKGTYYKVDYSPGTDISRFKNIKVPTSYMAITSKYDFVGGYEHDTENGLLHVANHHISPGKKQWTWGNGDFGSVWYENLTDEDGPYIELMCGVYTDNQPDFSWLMPGEEKTFCQYFMPYRDLGLIKNATKDAIVNLEIEDRTVTVKVYTTAPYPGGRVLLQNVSLGNVLIDEYVDFHPETSWKKTITLPSENNYTDLQVRVERSDGVLLVTWQPEKESENSIPEPAEAAEKPENIASNDQLYLTGLHLEQYRHATRDPLEYYIEAVRRDNKDSRCHNAIGLWYLKRGSFTISEHHFREVIGTLTERNPNPIDGEPFYNLGLTLRYMGRDKEAYGSFYKSIWNASYQDSGYYQLACIAVKELRFDEALELIEESLAKNIYHHKANHLKAVILRKLDCMGEAEELIKESLKADPFQFGMLFERYLADNATEHLQKLKELIRQNIHNYIEFALDYAWAGCYEEAIEFIKTGIAEQGNAPVYPMAYYYKAWFEKKAGLKQAFPVTLKEAAKAAPEYCFPNQLESIEPLTFAMEENPHDSKAPYYLGNFWYNAKNYEEAINCWEKSRSMDATFPTVCRNLALAYYNKVKKPDAALEYLEKAFLCNPSDSRVLMELDKLKERLNFEPEKRLQNLEKYLTLCGERDDLYLERIKLLNILGAHKKALDLLLVRKFHPWEGGEGKVSGQYVYSLIELAKEAIYGSKWKRAVELLKQAQSYPGNLGEGKLFGAQENELFYWMGIACEGLQHHKDAVMYWTKASMGLNKVETAIYYNDQKPDTIYYQGLALEKLGKHKEAHEKFSMLISFGQKHKNDEVEIDYFAVSLPSLLIWDEDLELRNRIECTYLMGLGYLGHKKVEKATELFQQTLAMDKNHLQAAKQLKNIELRVDL